MIHVLHGIHQAENGSNISQLVPYLQHEGLNVKYHNYGYAYAILARFQNPGRAERLKRFIHPNDICIGHSNGCTLIYMMAMMGAPIKAAILINPALDETTVFPSQVEKIDVYHNQGDKAVWFSEFFGFFDLLPHPWGKMGQVGFVGKDSRVTNIDCQQNLEAPIYGHSAIFRPDNLMVWGPSIAAKVAYYDAS